MRARQRGAAMLIVTLGLFFAMALTALAVNSNLVFTQRAATHHARATQAHEAAEAGIEWSIAQLNHAAAIGSDCLPGSVPPATSFRERYLRFDAATARFTPVSAQPLCVHGTSVWTCSCPDSGAGQLPVPEGLAPAPAFAVRLIADAQPGVVRIVSSGCTSLAGTCLPGSSTSADATAQVSLAVALFAGLRTPPASALTAGHVGPTADLFFASFFGIGKTTWSQQPVAARVACSADCSAALGTALAAGHDLVWVDGDLRLDTPAVWGSTTRPVVLVAGGRVSLGSAVQVIGTVYGHAVDFQGGSVQGAAISETVFDGAAAAGFDADVLARLARRAGSFVRVNGSWRDF